ncbi:MAG: response regulator [Phycisphaeraceae bacterium]
MKDPETMRESRLLSIGLGPMDAPDQGWVRARARELFEESQDTIYCRADRLFGVLLVVQYIVGIALAVWLTPRTWIGTSSQPHIHLIAAVGLNALVVVPPVLLAWLQPGRPVTRHAIAIAQMIQSALLIHLTGGRIETHFHVFASLAVLAFYRDWRPLITATVVVAVDHFLRGIWYPQSVYGIITASPYRWIEHACWVLLEVAFLVYSSKQSIGEMRKIADRQAQLEGEVEQRKQSNEQIESQRERLRLAMRAGRLGLWDWDVAEDELYFSEQYYEMLGYEPGEFAPSFEAWRDLLHPEDCDRVVASAEAHLRGETSIHSAETRMRRKDGVWQWIHTLGEVVHRADDGSPGRMIGVHVDIDHVKRAEQSLAEARDAAEAASRAKSEFLATMSHEIRTPINGVTGMLELLESTGPNPQQHRYIDAARTSADTLLTLINDILDFSKIEAGRLEIEHSQFDLEQTIEDTMAMLSERANRKGLELTYSIRPDVHKVMLGDQHRLRQVLLNLINNAIKFTEKGEVVVSVEAAADSPTHQTLQINVRDTGVGIASDRVHRLFKSFSQADSSMTRKFGGSGLGLAISKRLCELMGGSIEVDSVEGIGSIFRATIGVEKVQGDVEAGAQADTSLFAGHAVLIVDDNATTRQVMEQLVTQWGLKALTAAGADEACELLGRESDGGERVTLGLVDMVMPGDDGLALCRRIRERPEHRDMKLILCNSRNVPPAEDALHEAGCDLLLNKPIGPSRLFDSIMKLVGPAVAERVRAQPGERARAASREAPRHPAGGHWRILLAEDNPINQMVARELLEAEGFDVTTAATGAEAVDAVRREPFDLVLMDCQMPEMDGFEATARIEALHASGEITARPRIVALTANAMHGDRERCLEAGMDEYLSKPLNRQQMLATITRLLGRDKDAVEAGADGGRVAGDAPAPLEPGGASICVEDLLRQCMNNGALARRVLSTFNQTSPDDLAALRDAVERGDKMKIEMTAHKLKGGAAQVAAERVSRLAGEIEELSRQDELGFVQGKLDELHTEVEQMLGALPGVIEGITVNGAGAMRSDASERIG